MTTLIDNSPYSYNFKLFNHSNIFMSTKKEAVPIAKKIVKDVLKGEKKLSEVYDALTAKKEAIRYPNAIAIQTLGEEIPEKIYPKFDYFVELINSDNAFHRSIGLNVIADLTKVDTEMKFEKIFEKYFDLLDDKSVMVARQLTMVSGKIMEHKQNLREKIVNKLLNIDKTHHDPNRSALIWGDIVEAFSMNFEELKDKKKILEFVKKQLKSASPTTVKKAKAFLEKWNG
jgi:hypothetical protein